MVGDQNEGDVELALDNQFKGILRGELIQVGIGENQIPTLLCECLVQFRDCGDPVGMDIETPPMQCSLQELKFTF